MKALTLAARTSSRSVSATVSFLVARWSGAAVGGMVGGGVLAMVEVSSC